ncbi:hypothetical protein [Sphingomonas sp.]|uniref:hypothetical protein n=1 Tax=Sphingomonas sp. TaxID=28214 RepID=UPI003CC58E2D
MIVRRVRRFSRFRRHVATHNWFGTAIDLAILVLGVFLGLQANNWNAARLNQADGHEYRQRLIGDLADNESDLVDRGRYYAGVRAHAQQALAGLDRPAGASDAALLIDVFEATQITPRKVKRFTYDELLSRGATPWIGDARLREQVANYYVGVATTSVTFDAVTPYRELVRSGMPDAAQQAVRRACPERISFTPDGSGRAELAAQCAPLPLDPATTARSAAVVRALPGLRAALNRQISDHDGKIALVQPLVRHARDVRRLLGAADRR